MICIIQLLKILLLLDLTAAVNNKYLTAQQISHSFFKILKATLPPLDSFGVWWSRYYKYSDQQVIDEVLNGYAKNGLPLNNLVLDMDW